MRIFTAVRHSLDPARFYGALWADNFYPALRAGGHQIIESQVDLLPASRFMDVAGGFTDAEQKVRSRITEQILSEVREATRGGPVDLFLGYFYNAHFDPSGFDELRRLGVPSVNFYCNSIHQFPLVRSVAEKVDVSWFPERDAEPMYRSAGARGVRVQMGADAVLCHPVEGVTRQPRACFVGQRYADRDRWVAALLERDIPVDLYGAGWSEAPSTSSAVPADTGGAYLGRPQRVAGSLDAYRALVGGELATHGVAGGVGRVMRQWRYRSESRRLTPLVAAAGKGRAQSLSDTFAAYEVVLNFSNVWGDGRPGSALIPHVRLRDFEGPMSRTCYLTGHTDEIAESYEIGKEIDTYSSPAELADKIRYYLTNPAAAESLREAGYRRALGHHTWAHRFRELFTKLKLPRT